MEDLSLRDELSKAMTDATNREDDAPPVNDNAQAPVDTLVEESAEDKSVSTGNRDEKGRFKPKVKDEALDAKIEEPVAVEAAQEVKPAVVRPETMPAGWSNEVADKWSTLPPEVQAYISKRELEMNRFATTSNEERSLGKSMKEVITPYLPIIQAEGGTPQGAVKDLLNTAYILRQGSPQQKAQAVLSAINQFGVDLELLNQGLQNAPKIDPQMQGIQQELEQLKRERQQEKFLKEQQDSDSIQAEIAAFSAKSPYFDQVRAEMAAMMQVNGSLSLQEAYDRAIWANPEVRSAQLSSKEAEANAKRKAELDAKKKAAVSVTGSPGIAANSGSQNNNSLREDLYASFNAHLS